MQRTVTANSGQEGLARELREENRRLRTELRQMREVVERSSRLSALGTLAASIVHEIRNPLVSVRTFFQLAPRRWHDEEFAGPFRELTEKEVLRICDLVTELLDVARPAERAVELADAGELLQSTAVLLTPRARRHGVRLVCEGAEGVLPIRGCADEIKQVLLNIILNAVEATPRDGLVAVDARQVACARGQLCRIRVRDTGPGIPPEHRESVFAPFHTTKREGTGLGLSIARRIIREHGGDILIEESGIRGASFVIELPAAMTEPRAQAQGV